MVRRHQVGAGTPGLTVEDLREYNKQDSRTALVEGYLARLVAAPGGAEGAADGSPAAAGEAEKGADKAPPAEQGDAEAGPAKGDDAPAAAE